MSPYPTICPDCGEFLDLTTNYPGEPEATVTVSCPGCGFAESFEEEPVEGR